MRMTRRTIRVLLACDDTFRYEPVRGALERAGFEITGTVYAANLLNLFGLDTPDILVLDSGLSDADVADLGQSFRRKAGIADMPIVYICDSTDSRTRVRTAAGSAEYFLSRPGELVRLIKLLDDIVAERGLSLARNQPAFPTRVVWPTGRRTTSATARS
jgi:DNA-binding response OmpR family regulator